MRSKMLATGLVAVGALMAQGTVPTNSAVSGVVKDRTTGQPLANYTVSTWSGATYIGDTMIQTQATKNVQATTDSSGRYKLLDLPPGEHRIEARDAQRFGPGVTRHITTAGVDIEGIDFLVKLDGTIKGKVVDENKEPVPGMTISLVSREYFMGNVGYYIKGHGRTNDLGEYTVERVEAGHPYLILAEKRGQTLPAFSEVPLDPKLRKRVPMRTYYPNSPEKESAEAVVLRPGERREGMDIEVKKSQSYCIEGSLTGPNGPAGLSFSIEPLAPGSGISSGGGVFSLAPGGPAGAGGRFRICDLYPGTYRFVAMERAASLSTQAPNFAAVPITISDEDQRNLKIPVSGGIPLEGDVVLDGAAPATPLTAKVIVSITPMLRAPYASELGGGRSDIPGTFSFPAKLMDDYRVSALLMTPGLYVKDITYADRSVMYEPLRLGSAMAGSGRVRVIVGQDGATLSVRVADKDGNPGADMHVLLLPADARSEGILAARVVQGQTDQTGQYTSTTLAPGKYYAVATEDSYDATVENISKLWRSRNRFKEVDVAPGAGALVNLEPVKID
ncbi:MAG: carboxypeptidase regulatory-like domain-containing protein [Bryobacteraceae bacterium]